MTHDELLAKIYDKGAVRLDTVKYNPQGQQYIQEVFSALRAVVELHKPMENFPNVCGECAFEAVVLYPCQTIQAIEKELG